MSRFPRTLTGAEQFCAIRSDLATASKHDIGFFFDAYTGDTQSLP